MANEEPIPGTFFEPDPSTLVGPEPEPRSLGPVKVELGRLETQRYRLCRPIGYCDIATNHSFVVPRQLDTWTCDLSSNPVIFSWVIPVLGHHFTAILLHDGLVEDKIYDENDPGQGDDYIGPKVTREEADRITRDAMRELGTGFLRRWIAWAGMLVATMFSAEGIGGRRRAWFRSLTVIYFASIGLLGTLATLDLFDVWNVVPWMNDQRFVVELVTGLAGAIVFPILAAPFYWRRWQFAIAAGWSLAPLLPAIAVTAALTGVYLLAERILGRWLSKDPPPALSSSDLCECPEGS